MPSPSDRSPQRGVVQQPERKSPRRSARKPARKPPRTAAARRWPVVLLRLLAAGVVVGALVFMYLDAYIQREFSGKKWAVPAMVYGRPLELYAGAAGGAARAERGAGNAGLSRRRRHGGRRHLQRLGRHGVDRDARLPVLGRRRAGAAPARRVRRQFGADGPRRAGRRSRAGAARAGTHRRDLPGAQRGPHPGARERCAAAADPHADGGRGPELRLAPRRLAEGHRARDVGQREQRRARAGRQHA